MLHPATRGSSAESLHPGSSSPSLMSFASTSFKARRAALAVAEVVAIDAVCAARHTVRSPKETRIRRIIGRIDKEIALSHTSGEGALLRNITRRAKADNETDAGTVTLILTFAPAERSDMVAEIGSKTMGCSAFGPPYALRRTTCRIFPLHES